MPKLNHDPKLASNLCINKEELPDQNFILITTKVHSVLKCNLKINSLSSSNGSSYEGVDLPSFLFWLLCGIKENKFVLLSDINRLFKIKIKENVDRN